MKLKFFAFVAAGAISLSVDAQEENSGAVAEIPGPESIMETRASEAVVETSATEEVVETSATEEVVETSATEEVVETPMTEEIMEETVTEEVVETRPSRSYSEPSSPRAYSYAPSSKSVVEPSAPKGVIEPTPQIIVEEPLGATLSAGYMSKYIFYGADYGDNGIWTGIDYTITQTPIPIDIGAWYINIIDPSEIGPSDELDLYASIAGPSFWGFDTNVIYTAFLYPEGPWGSASELAAGVGRSLGFADMEASAHYDFDLDAWYFETALNKGFSITDALGVTLSTGISYQINYNEIDGRWNHVFVMATIPIELRKNVILEPYIGALWTLDALRYVDRNLVHGGVSISVSF